MKRISPLAGFAALSVVLGIWTGCSSSSPAASDGGADCHTDPTMCPKGQTCWPLDTTPTFGCLAANEANTQGATCEISVGIATCADFMACDTDDPTKQGQCTLYCDVARGRSCPATYACRATHVGGATGPTIQVCRKDNEPVGDGGLVLPYDSGGGFLDDGGFIIPDAKSDAPPNQQ